MCFQIIATDCKRKWNTLRIQQRRIIINNKKGKKQDKHVQWHCYNALQFLIPHMESMYFFTTLISLNFIGFNILYSIYRNSNVIQPKIEDASDNDEPQTDCSIESYDQTAIHKQPPIQTHQTSMLEYNSNITNSEPLILTYNELHQQYSTELCNPSNSELAPQKLIRIIHSSDDSTKCNISAAENQNDNQISTQTTNAIQSPIAKRRCIHLNSTSSEILYTASSSSIETTPEQKTIVQHHQQQQQHQPQTISDQDVSVSVSSSGNNNNFTIGQENNIATASNSTTNNSVPLSTTSLALNYFLMDIQIQMDKLNELAQMELKIEIQKLILNKLRNSNNYQPH